MKETAKALTLKTINKSNVWDLQENDVFRMWEAAEKDADLKDNVRHYTDIIRSAFDIEEIKIDKPEVVKKYEERGFKVGMVRVDEANKVKWGIKKRPIMRVTDLTYENIRHISAAKLIEVLNRNFGGGWASLSQSIQDIIQSGFDISTTTLPKDRLKKKGGMYEKKIEDGFEVLEIPKGSWVEAIFAKEKPLVEKPRLKFGVDDEDEDLDSEENEDEDAPEIEDTYGKPDEDDDDYDEDRLTEESYRTTYEENPEDLSLDAVDASDDDVLAIAKILRPECDKYAALLTVDDRINLLETGLFDGVHLGKNDMPIAEAKKLTGNKFLLGATCNTEDDVFRAISDGADYIGMGPFRFTTTKKNLSAIKDLSDALRKNADSLKSEEIDEAAYIEACLWLSLEAMLKLLSVFFTRGIPREYAELLQSLPQLAFEYGRYVLYSEEQAILEQYIQKQHVFDERLRREYETYLEKVRVQAEEFQRLIDDAFCPDIREALANSSRLARAAGVKDEEILKSLDDVDAFFLD